MAKKTTKKSTSSAAPDSIWGFCETIMSHPDARTMYVWGPPGTGKTYTSCRFGLDGRPVYVITLTPETPAAELRGFYMPKGDEFVWTDGVFIKAMREGARVVINEVAHASHDIMAILYPVLESEETASLTLPTGETITPSKGFQVICTDNQPPEQLPDALKDRFNAVIEITEPHPDALSALKDEYKDAAMSTFNVGDGRGISLRGWLSAQKFADGGMDETVAFKAAFGKERGEQLASAIQIDRAK